MTRTATRYERAANALEARLLKMKRKPHALVIRLQGLRLKALRYGPSRELAPAITPPHLYEREGAAA